MNLKEYIKHPTKTIIYLDNNGFIKLSDRRYLKMKYKLQINAELNLENPQTFNEKLQWLKLYNRKPEYTKMVDKYEAKKYVSNIIGEEYIVPTLGVWDKFEDIDFNKLPNQFVLKCTHDSGGLVICKDKSKFNITDARKKIIKSMKRNYFYSGREWPYKNVKPRIIAEKYMKDEKRKDILDYKIFCFNGNPYMTLVCSNRNFETGEKDTDFYDTDWTKLSLTRQKHTNAINKIERPKNYETMLELSKILAKDIAFVRVDWYEINGNLFFGELTFYPSSGFEGFQPEEWDKKLGNMLELS